MVLPVSSQLRARARTAGPASSATSAATGSRKDVSGRSSESSRPMTTPLARAIRPASRSSPSETSIMEVAPAAARAGPAARAGLGARKAARQSRT